MTDLEKDPVSFTTFWLKQGWSPENTNADVVFVTCTPRGYQFQYKKLPGRTFAVEVREVFN